ncbi:MAG: right-handed parallel beta-helix repeat-containing protein [Phycisphaerae bacterium]|nr:right-handed parallel beta-helix repeat-containing protein [Phycisphaerae bacterium]
MRIRSPGNFLAMSFFLLIATCAAAGKVIYVDADAAGANDGSSWANAYNYLRSALAVATSGDEIRVARGIYRPHELVMPPPPPPVPSPPPPPPDRTATFQLKNGVVIKGGFAGFGEPDPDAQDIGLYETILSGDLAGNDVDVNEAWDVWREPTFVDNSYHVVTGSGTNSTAVLDGFTIARGCASGPASGSYDNDDAFLSSGAGMLNDAGSPTVLNCTFRKNTTWTSYGEIDGESGFDDGSLGLESTYIYLPETSGAAVFDRDGSPTFRNCLFEENVAFGADASSAGAGVCNINSNPLLENCVFRANVVTGFDSEYYGGAMANYNSNPRIRYCSFIGNQAEFSYGGAIYSEESRPSLTNCTFRNNKCGGNGGAIFLNGGNSNIGNCIFDENVTYGFGGGMCIGDGLATLTNCNFTNNRASDGGGLYSNFRNSLTLKKCKFIGNSAGSGGAIENSGAWYNEPNSTTLIADCVFTVNSAYLGGGIYNGWNRKNLTVFNCVFAGNGASSAGGGIYNYGCEQILSNCTFAGNSAPEGDALACDLYWQQSPSNLQITNCIFRDGENGILNSEDSIVTITYSDVEGGWPGEGNIDAAPLFVEPGFWDPNGTPTDMNDDFWVDGDYHLLDGSPCIDAGDNTAVPTTVTTDIDGKPRILNGIVDMGAYESQAVFFVDIDATGANDGSSWVNAFNRIEDAIAAALIGDEIRVAQGTYRPTPPPPYQASNPNPADGSTGVGTTADLSWIAGHGAALHDVYFGTASPGVFQGNQINTTFDPGTMALGTKYYWRIDEVGISGTTTGVVWSFTTDPGPPPSLPLSISASGAQEVTIIAHSRLAAFALKEGIILKGGYAGFGEPAPDARDIEVYKTVLSGDMNGDDAEVNDPCDLLTDPSRADNCYHVITAIEVGYYGPDTNTILDGFIITGGNADGQYPDTEEQGYGGGMYNRLSSPKVLNCTFTENSARYSGGGMENEGSWPYLINCTFSRNFSNWGGGLANGDSRPTLIDCTFIGNVSSYKGGAMANYDGSPPMDNCNFIDNSAVLGGAIYGSDCTPRPTNCTFIGNTAEKGGVVYNNDSSIILENCKITGNWATTGGVIYDDEGGSTLNNCVLNNNTAVSGGVIYSGGDSYARLTNCILSGNAAESGGVVYICNDSNVKLIQCSLAANSADNGNALACDSYQQQYPSGVEVSNSILWDGGGEIWNNDGSEITITYSDVQGGWPGEGNIDAEPLFIELGHWETNVIWIEGDYRLRAGSPCIDAGTDADVYEDIVGNIRPFDFPGVYNNGELPDFDMGAYEAVAAIQGELFVQPNKVNLNARSKKIVAVIRLPVPIGGNDIDMSEWLVLYPGAIEADEQKLFPSDETEEDGVRIRAVFHRAELLAAMPGHNDAEVTIIGRFISGEYFYGADNIRVEVSQQ